MILKPLRLLSLCALLFVVVAGLQVWLFPALPRYKLQDGRELRVLKVSYGVGDHHEHDLGRAAAWKFWVWSALPKRLQETIPSPAAGLPGMNWRAPVVAVWVIIQSPDGHRPDYQRATGFEDISLDGQVVLKKEVLLGGNAYEFIFTNPETDSPEIRFRLVAEEQVVHVKVRNPGYRMPASRDTPMPRPKLF